jgi:hypothetical protein
MHRNHPLKNSKIKKAPTFSPPTNPATLNVVSFGFRATGENTGIQGSTIEWEALDSKIKEINNK